MRGATLQSIYWETVNNNFNPRTPCGVRRRRNAAVMVRFDFNSRTPCGVRPGIALGLARACVTSIHAPHAGCDPFPSSAPCAFIKLQFTHLMRGATISALRENNLLLLQFTHPMRGTTCLTDEQGWHLTNFNPRTPCGARRDMSLLKAVHITTSIHALHAGRDETRLCELFGVFELQFTHPMRGATQLSPSWQKRDSTSIHAPRMGCDSIFLQLFALCNNTFIHLRQIVFQLCCLFFLVFTAKLFLSSFCRCESPWEGMSNGHSHLQETYISITSGVIPSRLSIVTS